MRLRTVAEVERRTHTDSPHKGPVTRRWFPFDDVILSVCGNLENIHKSDVEVTFELYVHFRCLQVLYLKWTTFTKYCLTQIYCERQYIVNFMGLVGIVNANVYKTESFFTYLGHGKLSQFLTLLYAVICIVVFCCAGQETLFEASFICECQSVYHLRRWEHNT